MPWKSMSSKFSVCNCIFLSGHDRAPTGRVCLFTHMRKNTTVTYIPTRPQMVTRACYSCAWCTFACIHTQTLNVCHALHLPLTLGWILKEHFPQRTSSLPPMAINQLRAQIQLLKCNCQLQDGPPLCVCPSCAASTATISTVAHNQRPLQRPVTQDRAAVLQLKSKFNQTRLDFLNYSG